MSKIDKLQIRGIRSFDARNPMSIQFHAPLTLIVGTNGSGKTTIIECLKYVTTGELPPNAAKGASFVHDPSMAGEKEVLAQVKVSFTSTGGARMVCTRNLQLTVKKATRTVKTLEGSIKMVKDGEKNTMSSRVTEMNTLMPRSLGVSKAILENVIFCHQEDSLWPLAAPKDLKEKFDQIFEALKYTKAIENIKILQKNQRVELGKLEIEEKSAAKDQERARELKANRQKLTVRAQQLETQRDDFGRQMQEASRQATEIWKKVGDAEKIVGELNGKRIARDTKQESVESLQSTMEMLTGTDAELQAMLDQHEERIEMYKTELAEEKADYQALAAELKEARVQASAKEREAGSYEAQKQNFDHQVENRKRLVQETARSHDIRGYDYELDDAQVKAFMEQISRKARDQQAEFERARTEAQEKLKQQQSVLTGINEKSSAKRQSKETAKTTIATYDRKVRTLQAEQNKLSLDEGGKTTLESQLKSLQDQLSNAKGEMNSSDWNAIIETAEAELRRLEDRKDKLDAECAEAARRAGDSAQLDYVQKELNDRQRSLDSMQKSNGNRIAKVLGDNWRASSLDQDYERALTHSTAEVAEAERQRNGTEQGQHFIASRLRERNDALKAAEREQKSAEQTIEKALGCRPERYREELSGLEEERDALKSGKDGFEALSSYLRSCIKTAESHNFCKTCMREFGSKDKKGEHQRMKAEVEKYLEKHRPKEDADVSLDDTEGILQTAKAAGPAYEAWEKLKHKSIPDLRSEISKLETERDQLTARLEQQDNAVELKKSAKADIDALARTVQNMVKYVADISSFESQIKELTAKQKEAGLSRGLEAVQIDIKKANEEAKAAKARHSEATNSRDRTKTRISSLELQISDAKGKLRDAKYQLQQKKSLQAQEDEYRSLIVEQRKHITTLDAELQDLATELSTEKAKYDEITRRRGDQDRNLQDKANKLNKSVSELKSADGAIQAYHDKGGDEQLRRSRREVESTKKEVTRIEESQMQAVSRIKQLETRTRDDEGTKTSIINNQRYRKDLKALDTVRSEISELEQTNAEADKKKYEQQVESHQRRRNEAASKQASVTGQLTSINDQLEQIEKDWRTTYANAGREFRKAHIKVETTKAAIEDLGRYAGALDKAIMKYHSLKMDAINAIIGDLWRRTYQGTDVDTILIRSESETVKANKSYNYRVCMMKQDVEMDMRGRCSAGQKVLASIIIRLALADCFGVNCGMIALDEPTTNLDQENIEALARSLADIIQVRRTQSNFQLIVITHDETFLKAMSSSEYTDDYFRVSRGPEQESCIDKQSIANL
ncbi:DNA repair protein RAD50 [Fulvia fulva]|uniref:DNA repair protein RAD50 n=1 Tax=Passalora fulva TaxID=5499 RepID=A0A9Q8PIQ4_PASFU|nr:DNA repair protein RAD50 [Fulvia fulva]KAK4626999.1 DNA repair protein RAD50 [Fulvia fulva]KAK4628380.1 DNA repair protein RAD50 [Fulvia fulva]UJO23120.1 DNA repair protein RAD50 [Fulvia fulva]WPV13120.1 DNA repair protein RAD50 [Fulvia fulva]WPV29076.1 DNA repair protein RAD50 [Fulvia fulva]